MWGGLGGQEVEFRVGVVFVLFVEMVIVVFLWGRGEWPVSEEIWGGGSSTRGDAGGVHWLFGMRTEKFDDVDEGGSDSYESMGVGREI